MNCARKVSVVALAVLVLAAGSVSAQEWSAEQQEVWGQVEAYWEVYFQGDVPGFLAVFHDDYKGWQYGSPLPTGKASSEKWLTYSSESFKWVIYEIIPASIVVVDNIAIVHYFYSGVYTDAEGEKTNNQGRWTDVLMKDGDKWLIIADHGGRTKDQ